MDKLKSKDIKETSVKDFEIEKFEIKHDALKKISRDLLKVRAELLIKFTKKFIASSTNIKYSGNLKKGSLAYNFLRCKNLALPSSKDKILDKMIEQRGGYGVPDCRVNRNRASVFATEGKVDHDGTETIFGQCWQICKNYNSNYTMFIQRGVDSRCWYANFIGEGSIDVGGPFRDSLDNIIAELESEALPLLIKSSNNRNDHGSNRDCFILNPSARSPTHLEMFKFLGAFLSYNICTKAPVPIHLAPVVWKQLLGDDLDLEDLESFDAYSSQVLKDLKE